MVREPHKLANKKSLYDVSSLLVNIICARDRLRVARLLLITPINDRPHRSIMPVTKILHESMTLLIFPIGASASALLFFSEKAF